jgi:eukaryotic-like serine/threonine-protein kinase
MVLIAGTKLGPYEILGPLGAGGMGEVYRARDPVLDRDVAIKVLLSLVSSDPVELRTKIVGSTSRRLGSIRGCT